MTPEEAAAVLQRVHRRRVSLRSWKGCIEQLRAAFVDADVQTAISNGSDATFYEDGNLLKRDRLRHDPVVVAALAEAWDACSQGQPTIDREGYFAMSRRLYLVLCTPTAKVSPHDWQRYVRTLTFA